MKAIKTAGSTAEKKSMRFAMLVTTLTLLIGATAEAQIDPSSAMLLNANRTNTRDGGLDSGRYTVKPKTETVHTTRKQEVKVRVEETSTVSPVVAPTTATPSPTPSSTSTVDVALSPTPAPQKPPQKVPQRPPQTLPQTPPQKTSQVVGPQSSQAPQIPTFEPQDPNETPYERAPRDERRFTMLELSFAPGYIYNESKSTFSPRNYVVNAPSMSVDASVWTSPNFGVHTAFTGTLNANITDSYNNTKNASASEQWFSAGARARSYFGSGPKAPTLQFGVDYREFEFKVPSDTLIRNKLTTTGLHILIDAELPTSGVGTWTLGGEFGPKLSHRESSNQTEFRSGESPQATSVEVHLGARYRFDHANSLFWKLSYGVERDLFSGNTTINDPVTGLSQTDVGVTNSFTLFQLGYTWAN